MLRRRDFFGIAPKPSALLILIAVRVLSAAQVSGADYELAGRSVLVATGSQLTAALALIELDGIARRLVILPPDAEAEHLGAVITMAGIDAVVVDQATDAERGTSTFPFASSVRRRSNRCRDEPLPRARTEWVLMTSGTTGMPKMVVHDFAGLTAAHARFQPGGWRDRLGHVLRHSPLRRPANLLPRRMWRSLARPLQRRRTGRRSSPAPGRTRRHASFRHAVAMAPRVDGSRDPRHHAALRAALGRDRRPGDPRQPARRISACRDRPRLRLDGGRRCLRCQRRPCRLSCRLCRRRPRRRGDENLRRLAAYPLTRRPHPAMSAASERSPTPTASSTPAISSSGAATAIISPAARVASSISAD